MVIQKPGPAVTPVSNPGRTSWDKGRQEGRRGVRECRGRGETKKRLAFLVKDNFSFKDTVELVMECFQGLIK